ncbi:MAG: acyl-CoA desaturase [Chitinophagaceae bacterium]|nr:acyl-CoA desaturase [Chitinophagaceae bacterium]
MLSHWIDARDERNCWTIPLPDTSNLYLLIEASLLAEKPLKKSASDSHERIRFGNHKNPFFTSLKEKVALYFEKEELSRNGTTHLYLKASFFILTYFLAYGTLLLGHPPVWGALLLCVYLGLAAAAIGFNIMHDGSHGSFSDIQWINVIAAYSINILGGDAVLWKNKHNIIHHTYTNLEGHDQDIAQLPVLRLNSLQKKYYLHRFQHLYCFLVYGLSSLFWVFLLDFIKYFQGKVGNFKLTGMETKDHVIFWISKVTYFTFYLILPALVWGLGPALIGFFVFHFVLGTVLSTVFQLAHVVEEAEFSEEHLSSNRIADEWAVHQLKTTTNFCTSNDWMTWYVGGLNFQVVHHLFPKISHVHYPALNKMVKETCEEQQVIYHEFPSFMSALRSHMKHLKETANA